MLKGGGEGLKSFLEVEKLYSLVHYFWSSRPWLRSLTFVQFVVHATMLQPLT